MSQLIMWKGNWCSSLARSVGNMGDRMLFVGVSHPAFQSKDCSPFSSRLHLSSEDKSRSVFFEFSPNAKAAKESRGKNCGEMCRSPAVVVAAIASIILLREQYSHAAPIESGGLSLVGRVKRCDRNKMRESWVVTVPLFSWSSTCLDLDWKICLYLVSTLGYRAIRPISIESSLETRQGRSTVHTAIAFGTGWRNCWRFWKGFNDVDGATVNGPEMTTAGSVLFSATFLRGNTDSPNSSSNSCLCSVPTYVHT